MRCRRTDHRQFWKAHARRRNAFTIIELLVAISVISILIALLLPAVVNARAAARSSQCRNNLRNIGLAMVNAAESAGRLPASGNFSLDSRGVVPFHSWVVPLTPWLDRQDIFERWDMASPSTASGNQELANKHFAVLACPSDFSVTGRGDLSYVVNGGFGLTAVSGGTADCPVSPFAQPLDLNGNGITCPLNVKMDGEPGDKLLYFQTAAFFVESWGVPGTVRHHTLNDIVDGLSQTILLSENVRAGVDPSTEGTNWASADSLRNSFFISAFVCESLRCAPGRVDYRRANQGSQAINSSLKSAEGESPWPSSLHTGGVFVLFGDGHVTFLSEHVDGGVYASLVSPQGSRVTGPLQQYPLSAGDY